MAGSLDGVLANIPGLGGYLAKRQMNEQAPMQDLQQLGALAQLQAQSQAMQKAEQAAAQERQMRAELEALGPNPDQNALMRVASKYAPAQAILTSQTSSLDRQAARDAASVNAQAARDQRNFELQQRGEQEIARIREQAAQQRITREEADRREALMREQMARLASSLRQPQQPIVKTDELGNTKLFDYQGNLIRDLGKTSAPSSQVQKVEAAKKQTLMDLDRAITELGKATQDGGLIDKSTGSGAGALVDMGAGFFGQATPGAIAVGQLKPIYDLVLKMVPRFEGPQSDRDTKLYQDAAGQLANPAVPNSQKKAAGLELLRLMKQRRGQFISKDAIDSSTDVGINQESDSRAEPRSAAKRVVVDY